MSDLFNSLDKGPRNPQQLVQQLKRDPESFIKSKGFTIPPGVNIHDPQSIISGLMQSGQIGNGRFRQVMQMLGRR